MPWALFLLRFLKAGMFRNCYTIKVWLLEVSMSKPINVYVIRHGKTIFNNYDRMQGWSDTPLLEESEVLARQLGKNLKTINFDALYSSDSGRVYQTRDCILEGYGNVLPMQADRRFREFFFGLFEGVPVVELWNKIAKHRGYENFEHLQKEVNMIDRLDWIHQFDNCGAESAADFEKRIVEGLDDALEDARKQGYENVMLVCHGAVCAQLFKLYAEGVWLNRSPENLSVSKLVCHDDSRVFEFVNNTQILNQL